jgi:hypothetical protein
VIGPARRLAALGMVNVSGGISGFGGGCTGGGGSADAVGGDRFGVFDVSGDGGRSAAVGGCKGGDGSDVPGRLGGLQRSHSDRTLAANPTLSRMAPMTTPTANCRRPRKRGHLAVRSRNIVGTRWGTLLPRMATCLKV